MTSGSSLQRNGTHQKQIIADVIVLGCSLPGIVTAHKLKKKFGNTMDIVILDLSNQKKNLSKCNVAFQGIADDEETTNDEECNPQQIFTNICRRYLAKFANEFNITVPDVIQSPQKNKSAFKKLFEHCNGITVNCHDDYYNFEYLNMFEKFELTQYQRFFDFYIQKLFCAQNLSTDDERKILLHFDRTTMEKHLCGFLLFSTTREIMRVTIRLVCGAESKTVSVLFYLHQCYRCSGIRNQLDGDNTRFREKLIGFCRKRLGARLLQSIADITLLAKPIKQIRTYSDEQVILETIKGETNYVCNLLAMALRPDELNGILFQEDLKVDHELNVAKNMSAGRAKKFLIQYDDNFWRREGCSGDILSVRGPILWAMERPNLSTTGNKFAALIGYLKVKEGPEKNSQEAVIEHLVKLFGEEASSPLSYKETEIEDIFVPRCGDYVALRKMSEVGPMRKLDWSALDVFADGDVAAALQAGHVTYLNLVQVLRPQAQTYEDISTGEHPSLLGGYFVEKCMVHLNYFTSLKTLLVSTALYFGVKYIRSLMK